MDMRDFEEVRKLIRSVWKGAIESKESIDAWYTTMKRYSYEQIRTATMMYIQHEKFEPKPADILQQIPVPRNDSQKFDPTPVFVEHVDKDGKTHRIRTYKCQRCRDSGMITFDDDKGYTYYKVCNCPAGHYYFRWGWLTEEEQKEYVATHGNHGERIGESWY